MREKKRKLPVRRVKVTAVKTIGRNKKKRRYKERSEEEGDTKT